MSRMVSEAICALFITDAGRLGLLLHMLNTLEEGGEGVLLVLGIRMKSC